MPNGLIVIAHYHPAHILVEQFPVFQQAGDYLPRMNATTLKSEETYLPISPHHAFKFAAILNCTASKQKNNDEVEAIVYVTIIKTSEDNEKNSNSSDIHIMTLAPSSLNNGEYVVMEDIIDGSNMQVPHIQPLYTNG